MRVKSEEGNQKGISTTNIISDRNANSFALKSKSDKYHPSETTDTGTRVKSTDKIEERKTSQDVGKKEVKQLCEESNDSVSETDSMEVDHKKSLAKNCYSKNVTKILMSWLKNHLDYPYPTEEERIDLCEETGLTRKQLRIWLINTRKRKLEKVKYQVNELNKRDLKTITKYMENEEDRVKFWKTPRLPCQIPDKYKMSTVEVFETYKSKITEEYFLKLFYFTQVLTSYCFCKTFK